MNGTKRPPLDELVSLLQSTIAAEGITTALGAAAGNSIIDAGLIGVGANSFISMLMVLYPGQPRLVDSMDITAFNNGTGEVTFSTAYKGIVAAIPAGVPYKIVTFRFVPAEVAALTALVVALMADVGDASASTLGSIYAILGNPAAAQDLATRIGYQGAISLADKLTAARAAFLDAAISSRAVPGDAMALTPAERLIVQALLLSDATPFAGADIATIVAYVDELETRLTAARAGYLDNINQAGLLQITAARAALLDQITALRLAELDAANIPADVDTLLIRLSALRAGYLDNLSGGAVALAASWTAALATALGNYTAARAGYLDNINQAGLLQVTAARAALLDQITAARMAELDAANLPADVSAILADVTGIAELKPEWAARTSATHTTTGVTEETILTTAYTVPGLFHFNLTLRNMVAGDDFTIRVYKRVDGTNYDLKSVQNFIDAPAVKVYEIEQLYTDGTEFIRVTIQRNSGTNRAFPYSYNCIKQPVA